MEGKSRSRGFASMAEHKQREIARKGGRAAHEKGRAHEFTTEEARQAGRKGGEKVSVNRSHMAEIGRRGGKSSASRRRVSATNPAASTGTLSQDQVALERTLDDNEMKSSAHEMSGAQMTGMANPSEEDPDGQNPMAGV
ncbi:MAG: hypothetical protein H0T11_05540 [Chthoniobacterales bacterium]|nr:hypothetical protein [Chthoniobacterales bacterium]